MRKIGLLSILAFFPFWAQAQSDTLFSSSLKTAAEFSRWSVINANNDDRTWEYYESDSVARCRYSGTLSSDDWLISPAITVAKDGTYMLRFRYRGSSSGEKMDIWYGSSATVAGMTTSIEDMGSFTNGTMLWNGKLMNLKGGQTIYLGFHAKSDPDKFKIYLDSVSLVSSSPYDVAISAIVTPVTGMNLGQETVTVKVTNSGLADVTGVPVGFNLDGGTPNIEKISQTIAAGATVDYTFNAKADLSTPRKTYTLKVWASYPNDVVPSNDTLAVNVKHRAPATAPYSNSFETSADVEDIAMYNLNNDDGNWSVGSQGWILPPGHTGSRYMMYDYDSNNDGDDWFVLEPIRLTPGYYSFKFWYTSLGDHSERLAVYYGNTSQDPSTLTNLVVSYDPFHTEDFTESANVLHVTTEQVYYFGFKAFSTKDENDILLDDVSITPISPNDIDLAVTGISRPESYVRSLSSRHIICSVSNQGLQSVPVSQLTYAIDGKTIATKSLSLKAQETVVDTVKDVMTTLSEGRHQLVVSLATDGDAVLTNNTDTVNFTVVGMTSQPVKMWDFEDGKRPDEFTFVKMDYGTINSGVSGTFTHEDGWDILDIEKHAIFGEHMLGVTSWLDGTSQANRWCILPPITVTGPNAYFVWTSNSFQDNYPETYKIMISNQKDDLYNFDTMTEIINESTLSATHGVALGDSVGKTVYLAIRLVTRGGTFLSLDNLALYGDCALATTSISHADASTALQLAFTGKTLQLKGARGDATLVITDMAGRTCLRTNSTRVALTSLAPGIYIAKGTDAVSSATLKFVLK
jgi:hypothetical protein